MLNTSFSPWPSYDQEEAEAVNKVLLSNKVNYWTGNQCREFESEFAAWVGTRYAITLANGSLSLEAALRALGIGPGDEVIVTSRTFIASVISIVLVGAKSVFADVDRNSQNIIVENIISVITPKTKAIICVHLAGWPCDMDPIMTLAEDHGLYVVEDCAQAHGALYKGRSVGSIGHVGAWSFCQDKIITTGGEGGMITTNDGELWSKIWSYKDHGKSYDAVYKQKHSPGFKWLHESIGTNCRMTEIQATIGRIQLRRMNDWHHTRSVNANTICEVCERFPMLFRVPRPPEYIEHGWYKCYVFIRLKGLKLNWTRERLVKEISARGVPCFYGICSEIYLEKVFDNTNFRPTKRLPIAKELGETSLVFLVHPTLKKDEVALTCSVIEEVSEMASVKNTKNK